MCQGIVIHLYHTDPPFNPYINVLDEGIFTIANKSSEIATKVVSYPFSGFNFCEVMPEKKKLNFKSRLYVYLLSDHESLGIYLRHIETSPIH